MLLTLKTSLIDIQGYTALVIGMVYLGTASVLWIFVRRMKLRVSLPIGVALTFLLLSGAVYLSSFLGRGNRVALPILHFGIALVVLGSFFFLVLHLDPVFKFFQNLKNSEIERRELEQQNIFLDAVLMGLNETIIACDEKGVLSYINKADERLQGRDLGAVPPEQWPEEYGLFEADAKTPMYWRNVPLYRALNGAVIKNMEMAVQMPTGKSKKICVGHAQPLYDRQNRKVGAVLTIVDLAEKENTQQEKGRIAAAAERLESEKKIKQQFISALTHDLRNPLTAAKSSAQILRRYPDRIEQRDRLISRIERSVERADHMLSDLMDASLIETGRRLPVKIQFNDLAAIARDSVEEMRAIHGDRFVLVAPEAVTGFWCASGIRRIIENLISNAIKYGHDRRDITIKVEQDRETRISVHNFGHQIPESEQERLFTAFHRSDAAIKSGRRGWGIGLTVVKGLVLSHGGKTTIESQKETGTTFTVTLPNDARFINLEAPGESERWVSLDH